MANDVKHVRLALARALAAHKIDNAAIDHAAKQLATLPQQIRGINICQYGICIDLFLDGRDWRQSLQAMLTTDNFAWNKLEVFPYGILNPDMVHVRMGQAFEGMLRE